LRYRSDQLVSLLKNLDQRQNDEDFEAQDQHTVVERQVAIRERLTFADAVVVVTADPGDFVWGQDAYAAPVMTSFAGAMVTNIDL